MSPLDYVIKSLDGWDCAEAKNRTVNAFIYKHNYLNLGGLGLTDLPAVIGEMTFLETLELRGNKLLNLRLPILTNLKRLNLRDCNIVSLPTEIGLLTSLRELFLTHNSITSVPTEIGLLTSLRELALGGNRLTSLPREIDRLTVLTKLHLPYNGFQSLPKEIGNLISLTELDVPNNPRLTSLPHELGQLFCLTQLNITDNPQLSEFPLTLGQIPGLTHIEIHNTGINPRVRDAILHQCRMLRDAEAVKLLPVRLSTWKAIAFYTDPLDVNDLSDEQKQTLNEWLLRLQKTADFAQMQRTLARTVCSIVADILYNKEFQELFFPQAEANNARCEDRAAMSLNEIYTSWVIVCQSAALPLKEKVQIMTGVAKTLCLRKELQKLIGKEERESVEIFLYYESLLKEPLKLVTAIHKMTYGDIGKRASVDINRLIAQVNANFFEELFELPVFQQMVEKEMQMEWKAINEEFLGKLEECPSGDQYDRQVLDYQHRQGEIMQERRRRLMSIAMQWLERVK